MFSATDLEQHRVALSGLCYRMMGSSMDADDAVQETMVRAWKALGRFDGRSSLRTWLYRIATNVCLDMLGDRKRRTRPLECGVEGTPSDTLEQMPRSHWLEPVPDERVIPSDANPAEAALLKQSIHLAFVSALQNLPPKQRAVLLLTEVVGMSAEETASTLEMTAAAVNSALQRARATIDTHKSSEPGAVSAEQKKLVDRYVEAFLMYDVQALVSLLHDDAILSMPPYTLWLKGHSKIGTWLAGRGIGCAGSRLTPVSANGAPAFAQYRKDPAGGFKAWGIIVLELDGARIKSWNSFLDAETLFPRFGLPMTLSN